MRRPTALVAGSAAVVAALALIGNCARNPVTGRHELALIPESQEIAIGREGAAEVIRTIGRYPDEALQTYVSGIGRAVARRSQRPRLAWEFIVLDDASANAFALPGGYVFVTRGLLARMGSEAEVAAVLGHESGHVAARHGVRQMSRQQLAAYGLGIGAALSPFLERYGDLAAAGAGLLLLKNGRDDETQADRLGFWYAVAEGYDTREMIPLFEMLKRVASEEGGGRLPGWQATHPHPEHRIRDIERLIATSSHDFEALRVERDTFLRRLDGLTYGPDPRAGYFARERFVHPALALTFRFPEGWRTDNSASAVTAISGADDAIIQFRAAQWSASESADRFFAQEGMQSTARRISLVHGNRAVTGEFSAAAREGTVRGIASFIEHDDRTWAMIGYAPAARYETYAATFTLALGSLERLTDPVALVVQPQRIEVVELPRAMTLREFASWRPSAIAMRELESLNGVDGSVRLAAGRLVKRVLGPAPPR